MANDYIISSLTHCVLATRDFTLISTHFNAKEKVLILSFDEFAFKETEMAPWYALQEPQFIISDWKAFVTVVKSYPDKRIDIATDKQLVYLTDVCETFFTDQEVILSGFSKEEYRWTEYHLAGAKASLHFKEKILWEDA